MNPEQEQDENNPFEWPAGFFEEHWQNMPEFNQKNNAAKRQIIVSFDNDEDIEKFSKLVKQNITDKTKSIWFPAREKQIVKDLFWIEGEDSSTEGEDQ